MHIVPKPTTARGIRLSAELDREIMREAERLGRSRAAMTALLLDEAVRMRRAPGVILVDGPTGRRAVVAGSGIDVWEIVATWRAGGERFDVLHEDYSWLTEPQLRAALSYYERYPTEIEARLGREEEWTPERVARELPFSRRRS